MGLSLQKMADTFSTLPHLRSLLKLEMIKSVCLNLYLLGHRVATAMPTKVQKLQKTLSCCHTMLSKPYGVAAFYICTKIWAAPLI